MRLSLSVSSSLKTLAMSLTVLPKLDKAWWKEVSRTCFNLFELDMALTNKYNGLYVHDHLAKR